MIRTDLGFLAPIDEACGACAGSGLSDDSAHIPVRGRTFAEHLGRTVTEALESWSDCAPAATYLELLVRVGLGYLVLDQPGAGLSGGEAQRIKIVKELGRKKREGTLYILDEPTTGQSSREIGLLAEVLRDLADPVTGSTVLVLEHSPDLLAACDWLIELGPGGGPDGGRVIAEGPPTRIAAGKTPIACYLAARLPGREGSSL